MTSTASRFSRLFTYAIASALAVLLLAGRASAGNISQVIYDSQFENGWQSWSWANISDPVSTSVNGVTNSMSISDPSTGDYAALWLHPSADFNDSDFTTISFWVNGGPTGGQTLQVSGIVNENTVNGTVSLPTPIQANTWVQETIPLSALGVANVSDFAGIWIQYSTGNVQPIYYLYDAQLNGSSQTINATVSVSGATPLGTIPPTPVGINTAVWDGVLVDPNNPIPPILQSAGVRMLRYPAGSGSDSYNWSTNSNIGIAVDDSTSFGWQSDAQFDSFITNVAQPVGAQPIITVNYGSNETGTGGGDPALAASWVQYSNITKGYGVKYWEIGNEVYGNGYYSDADWETDLHVDTSNSDESTRQGQAALSPTAYGTNVMTYLNAMKAVDPTIKIGVMLSAPTAQGNLAEEENWNNNVLAQCGQSIDFVVLHWYPEYVNDSDSVLLQDPEQQIATMMSNTKAEVAADCGSNASHIQIITDETNSDAGTPGKQMMSTVQTLFMTDNIQTWLENGVYNVDYWDLHNGISFGDLSSSLFGTFAYGDEGMLSNGSSGDGISEPSNETKYATYYALKMVKILGSPGDTMETSTTSNAFLNAHAVWQANGNVNALVENTDPFNSYNTTISLSGFNIASSGNGTLYTYGPSSTDVTSSTIPASSSIDIVLPPYTMEMVSIPEASVPTPTINPTGGSFNGLEPVTISDTQSGATIRYTTDGSNPLTSSTAQTYTGQFNLTSSATVTAAATETGYLNSATTSSAITIVPIVPTPSIAPNGGSFNGSTPVSISDTQSGVTILYTIDGSNPATSSTAKTYSAQFNLTLTSTVNAVAEASGYANSAEATASFTITALKPSTTTLSSSLNPSTYSQTVKFTAKIAPTAATGTVTFTDASTATTLGTVTLASGVASLSVSTLTVGTHSVTATYSGDSNYQTSTSSAVSEVVGIEPTTISVVSYTNPSVAGYPVNISAILSLSNATGTISFVDTSAGTALGTMPITANRSTIVLSTLSVASHTISATYSGDSNHPTCTGSVVQVVNKYATSTSLKSNNNPSLVGQAVGLSADVNGYKPTGTVTFMDMATNTALGTTAVSASYATLVTSQLPVGVHSIVAMYSGDANNTASSSPALTQTVHLNGTTTTISSSANPSIASKPVTLTAIISATASTGTVTFTDTTTGTVLGTATVVSRIASVTVSTLSTGSHVITAVYSGDGTYATSMGTLTQTVH